MPAAQADDDVLSLLVVNGSGAEQVFSDVTFSHDLGGDNTPGRTISALNGGHITLNNSRVLETYTGSKTWGLYATGNGSVITANDTEILISGTGTNGGNAPVGTDATSGGTIILNGGQIRMTGSNRTIAVRTTIGGVTQIDGTQISTSGANSHAVLSWKSTTVTPTAALTVIKNATVSTSGSNSYALFAQGTGAQVEATNVTINTTGDIGRGAHAFGGGLVTLTGGTITTAGSYADGLLAAGTASNGDVATIVATGVQVTTNGQSSSGIGAGYFDGTGGRVEVAASNILTNGQDAAGVNVQYGGSVLLENTVVTATGAGAAAAFVTGGGSLETHGGVLESRQADAIVVQGNAQVTVTGTQVKAAGASIASTLDGAGQVQTIQIGNGADLTHNNGTLLHVSRTTDGMDGIVNLSLKAGSVSSGDIVDEDGLANGLRTTGKLNFTLEQNAVWHGRASGVQDATISDGASFVYQEDGEIAGNVSAGSGATVSFTGTSVVGGDVVAGSGTTVSFGGATTVAGDVSGSGATFTFSKTAASSIGGNLELDSGARTAGGSTAAPVTIAGNAVVNDSTLGGNLIVVGNLSGVGGSLSPGNSVGVQEFGSIVGFGGSYHAEINAAGQSDKIIVHGDADLSSIALTVGKENGTGGARVNTWYTIVQTDSGGVIQNGFASAATDASLLGTYVKLDTVRYTSTDAAVRLIVDTQKVDDLRGSLTANRNAVLTGVVSAAGSSLAADAWLTSTGAVSDLDQLAGTGYASIKAAMLEDARLLRDAGNDRLRNAMAGTSADAQTSTQNRSWARAFGSWGRKSGNQDAATLSGSVSGMLFGADGMLGNWRAGVFGGISRSDYSAMAFNAKADGYHAGVYGGTAVDRLQWRFGATYSHYRVDANRQIALAAFSDRLVGRFDAGLAQGFGEVAMRFDGAPLTVEPFAQLAYARLHTDGFDEQGGDARLHVRSGNTDLPSSTVGLRLSPALSTDSGQILWNGMLGWRHAYGSTDTNLIAQLPGGQAFMAQGLPLARDMAVMQFGMRKNVSAQTQFDLNYVGQIGSGAENHGLTASLRYRF